MSDKYILDASGNPQRCDDAIQWAMSFEQTDRQVADDIIGNVRVSTVFLGLDHRFSGDGDPILWETMIFGGKQDGYQDRYTSKESAIEGHQKALNLVQTETFAEQGKD